MLSLENDDDVVVCPYNPAHRLLRKRLQPHLIKCRENYPQLELQRCPFNNTHHIPEPEFCLHVTNCPDRKLITQYKYDAPEPKEEERVSHAPIECEENWDDTEVDDYDPQKFIKEKEVLRQPMGIAPAERKEFIKTERKRLGDEESYSESDDDYKDEVRKGNSLADISKKDENGKLGSIKRIRSISPSPPRQSRSRSSYYERTHVRGGHIPPTQIPPRISFASSSNRYSNDHIQPLPTPYDIDDDPYYNSGNGASFQIGNYSSSNSSHNPPFIAYPTRMPYFNNDNGASHQISNYNSSNSHNPPLIAYPTRMPSYGRGAYRGYNNDRGNSSRYNDRY
ncbi:PREDICTED: protein D7-like [Bactrocera latifrons]|nr:PREDICTED: protein D7-like [Bactrocera latifrons]